MFWQRKKKKRKCSLFLKGEAWWRKCYQARLGSALLHTGKPVYWHRVVVKESAMHQARSPGQISPQNTPTPWLVSGKHFKKPGEGAEPQGLWSARGQFSGWLMMSGEVTRRCHMINPQAPVGLGAACSWSSFGGGFSICKTTQEMCIRYCYLGTSERS